MLNAENTAVGIAVVQGRKQLFAVQDFSHAVEILNLEEQEKVVSALLSARKLKIENKSADARRNCEADFGISGITAISLIRFETGDLTSLPPAVAKRIDASASQRAAVGACSASSSSGFAHYRLVILLY
jgi:hypothetical protein